MGNGLPGFRRDFSCPAVLRILIRLIEQSHTGLSPAVANLSRLFCLLAESYVSVLQPQHASMLVWPVPFSLAATKGIAFAFSSCGYLDVSVRRVFLEHSYVFTIFIISDQGYWVPPFGNLRIIAYLQLPGAYRRSSRPSSAPNA